MTSGHAFPEEQQGKPTWLLELERCFGGPSQAAFGSAVFYQPPDAGQADSLEDFGREAYRTFCGETWTRFGPENWMAMWKRVYSRAPGTIPDVIAELSSLNDPSLQQTATLLWDGHENPANAQDALRQTFDRASPSEFHVYQIGDGQAMSGVMLLGAFPEGGRVVLVLLMD